MAAFIPGKELCEGFFRDHAKPILEKDFPSLRYSAGLIGYGSDVLGYDDEVSTDHMWGPRFYLFLTEEDLPLKPALLEAFGRELPTHYRGYSVNFSAPDPNDKGVRHPLPLDKGPVDPLIFIQSFDSFLLEQLGTADLENLRPAQWLGFSEQRLLSLVSGTFFVDGLGCVQRLEPLAFYPKDLRLYLIASLWEAIAAEQAFVKRCGARGDQLGSRLLCSHLAEKLLRLCFLYRGRYAPYGKWLGTAFARLDLDPAIGEALEGALAANSVTRREEQLVRAQCLVAELHNASGLTAPVDYRVQDYYGRDIQVIFAENFAQAAREQLPGTALEGLPAIGSLSQHWALDDLADEPTNLNMIEQLYRVLHG